MNCLVLIFPFESITSTATSNQIVFVKTLNTPEYPLGNDAQNWSWNLKSKVDQTVA